jgi:hypothetical protein
MSYNDDEELKIGDSSEPEEEEDGLDLVDPLDEPLDDDLLSEEEEDDDELSSEFAGLDGSSNDY